MMDGFAWGSLALTFLSTNLHEWARMRVFEMLGWVFVGSLALTFLSTNLHEWTRMRVLEKWGWVFVGSLALTLYPRICTNGGDRDLEVVWLVTSGLGSNK
jgi:hypothetical protein